MIAYLEHTRGLNSQWAVAAEQPRQLSREFSGTINYIVHRRPGRGALERKSSLPEVADSTTATTMPSTGTMIAQSVDNVFVC